MNNFNFFLSIKPTKYYSTHDLITSRYELCKCNTFESKCCSWVCPVVITLLLEVSHTKSCMKCKIKLYPYIQIDWKNNLL